MKKIILILILLVFISGCAKKECKTNEDCLAKTCFTAQCMDNKCVYSPVTNCCGNEICEVGETYPECAADCPNCDDANECTKDSYDYHELKCVNKPIPDVVCCGNSLCELEETYENCIRDCPSCDDENECTKDSYDYHEQNCVNEPIIPCCGNTICDENVETNLDCLVDCPSCDDDNKLTTDSFNYQTQECENPVTHYLFEDFENGTENWNFNENWGTTVEDGNTVLKGTGHNWAKLQMELDNYIFKFKFKKILGAMHVNFRHSSGDGGFGRYYISIAKKIHMLGKSIDDGSQILKENLDFEFDDNWHTMEVRVYNNIFNIYVDDEVLVKYKDTERPFLSGIVSFETHRGGAPEGAFIPEYLIDDVEIKLITEKDIIYP